MDPLLVVVGVLLILAGLSGVVIPVLPGLLLVWLGTAGTLLVHQADATGWALAAALTVLFLGGSAATIWLPTRQGRRGGASARSFVLAAVGAVVGFFVIPVVGFLVGALAGVWIGERLRLGEWGPAASSTGRVLRAYGAGVLVELSVGLLMSAIWVLALFLR